jgi:hypothetical protein
MSFGLGRLFDRAKLARLDQLAETSAATKGGTITQFHDADVVKSTLREQRTERKQGGHETRQDAAAWTAGERALSSLQLQIAGRFNYKQLTRELAEANRDPMAEQARKTMAERASSWSAGLEDMISLDLAQGRPVAEAIRNALNCYMPDAAEAFEAQLTRELKKLEPRKGLAGGSFGRD